MSTTPQQSQYFTRRTGPVVHAVRRPPRASPLVWLAGVLAPLTGLLLLAVALAFAEHWTHLPSKLVGRWLLATNPRRPASGTAWDRMLASRKTRARLLQSGPPDTAATAVPPAVTANSYLLQRTGSGTAVLSMEHRETPLRIERLQAEQMSDLAASLLAYRCGVELLQVIRLPREPLVAQARARAAAELESGELFAALGDRLRASRLPAGWDFARMSTADRAYWQEVLRPALAAVPADSLALSGEPSVDAALQGLLQDWAAQLRQAELERIQRVWEEGPSCTIHLQGTQNGVSGRVAMASGRAVPFELPGVTLWRVLQAQPGRRP